MILGITGKSCSGKNYVASLMARKGFIVLDLDREAEKIREASKKEVIEIFGTDNKNTIRNIVFTNPQMLRKLEGVLYPRLKEYVLKKSAQSDIVINGATLYRSGFDKLCRGIIYVDASYNQRLERAVLRDGISEQDFEKREASQNDIDWRTVQYNCPVYEIKNNGQDITLELDKALSVLTS